MWPIVDLDISKIENRPHPTTQCSQLWLFIAKWAIFRTYLAKRILKNSQLFTQFRQFYTLDYNVANFGLNLGNSMFILAITFNSDIPLDFELYPIYVPTMKKFLNTYTNACLHFANWK